MTETSDAAYEKRHRKFENFEKRQRLREKEKLKHEHYKLKERIEQLRGMDGAAFMTLPASAFSPAPPGGDDNEEPPTSPFPAMNGGIYHPEGERRRKEMLDIALKLEQRYTYLLPPERPRKVPEPSSSKEAESRDESDDEQGSGMGFRKESVPKLQMHTAKSSASSSSAPSPAALKSAVPRKSWGPEPRQSPYPVRNLRRNSSPANAVSAQPVLPSEGLPEPRSPSPEIDVEGPEIPPPPTYFLPPPPPPPPSQFVWSLRTNLQMPTVNVASLPFHQPQQPLGPPVMHYGNVSMESNEMYLPEGRVGEKAPVQNPPADVHVDVESEKASSEPEDAPRVDQSPPRKRRGRPPRGIIDATETVSATVAKGGDPPIVVPQPVPIKRRGRKPKGFLLAVPQAETELPEIRVMHTRFQGANMAESSRRAAEEHDKQPNSILEEAPVADEAMGSISTRPIKRRRRNMPVESATISAGARESSAQASDRGAPISATATSVRGKTFVTYVDSRTGETVCTPSLLMIACVRATEKFNIRKARETTSFGVPTPEFGKGAIMDYELQEEILYRHLRDKSQTTGPESGVEPSAREEGHGAREQEEIMEGDGEVHEGDDAAEQAEEEEVNIEQGDDEEFPIRPRGLGMHDEGEVAKEAVQPYPLAPLPREIVGRFVYGPPITLSPEPELGPDALSPDLHIEAHPGVRPREPSRHVDDEEELEW